MLCPAESHGYTALERNSRTKYAKATPVLPSIQRRHQEYQTRSNHSHMDGNDRSQINEEKIK